MNSKVPSPYLEKQAGFLGAVGRAVSGGLARGVAGGLAKGIAGNYAKAFTNFSLDPVRNGLIKPLLNLMGRGKNQGGLMHDQFGKVIGWKNIEGDGAFNTFRNWLGNAYMSSGKWGAAADRFGRRGYIQAFGNRNNARLANAIGKGAITTATFAPLVPFAADMAGIDGLGSDSKFGKFADGAGFLMGPTYWGWEYGTPLGLALSKGVPWAIEQYAEGVQDAGRMGAQQAINQTAEKLGKLSFTDRLGFLLAPQNAANAYRNEANSYLEQYFGTKNT